MEARFQPSTRNKAILIVRAATFGGAVGALAITWLFSNLAEAYFSGKPVTAHAPPPPKVPVAAVPQQAPPTVIKTVVHHPSSGRSGAPAPVSGPAPRPPAQGPAPAPPPPPPPVCHSTPSHPC
jgi:hypothetical protein